MTPPKKSAADGLAQEQLARASMEARRELARRHMHEFVRQAWPQVEPDQRFLDNWHLIAICTHLMAVADGRVQNLLINVPPGTMKSLLVCVFWPAWVWASQPGKRFMYTSYSESLSLRDSVKCRNLVESKWYQERWPLELADDQNAKGKFENSAKGFRMVASITGKGTGEHPDFNCFDDPHNVATAESEADRRAVIEWLDGVFATRGRGTVRNCRRVGVMQRLHTGDASGHLLENPAWRRNHICLPMRYEPPPPGLAKPSTSLGWSDPREADGELLWHEMYPEHVVADMEVSMGLYHAAGQFQQRPAPRGGGQFKREWFEILPAAPDCLELVRYFDKAGCLVAGTMVQTSEGEKRIEDVQPEDKVLTRAGFKSVEWAGVTKMVSELTTVVFSDGSQVTGTSDHPVLAKKRYWIELATLTGTDYAFGVWQTKSTSTSKQSYSMAYGFQEEKEGVISLPTGGTSSVKNTIPTLYIGRSGVNTMVPFPLARISTTLTVTGITTRLEILSASHGASTCSSIETSLGQRNIAHCLSAFVKKLWLDTEFTRKRSGTLKNAGKGEEQHGVELRNKILSVLSAAAISNARRMSLPSIVLINAPNGLDISVGVPVYDVSVRGKHEFFANGILVHNTSGGTGARTSGVLMARYADPGAALPSMRTKYVVLDVVNGRWAAAEREAVIKQTAAADRQKWGRVTTWVEQEPGSGGKESAEGTVGNLAGFACKIERVTGPKEVRAEPLAAQASVGKVKLLAGGWNAGFLDEVESFPVGRLKDQVDAAGGAFNKLAAGGGGIDAASVPAAQSGGEDFQADGLPDEF